MLLCAFDLETTGLDKQNDQAIEVGLILYSTNMHRALEIQQFLVKTDREITGEVEDVTGLNRKAVDAFGYERGDALDTIQDFFSRADAVVTHNGNRYDLPLTRNWAGAHGEKLVERLSIDSMTDIPNMAGEQLITMCARAGFLLSDAHSAVADAQGALRLATHYKHTIEQVVERAKSPIQIVVGKHARSENHLVKRAKFRWNPNEKVWWKPVKEMDLADLKFNFPWDKSDYTMEDLDTD
jgi:DNA polymerase III alpha subunit (gram-positive type)